MAFVIAYLIIGYLFGVAWAIEFSQKNLDFRGYLSRFVVFFLIVPFIWPVIGYIEYRAAVQNQRNLFF